MAHDTRHAQLEPGTLITDRLTVVRRIGAGGLGEVYEVEHKFTKHRRAVKVLHSRFRQDVDVVERFLNEASAAGRIGNPHIVETFDAGYLADGSPFIVMEFLEGRPLNEVLRKNGRLDVGLASAMLSQVCTAVQAAHDANIVHRDLKPENLFLTERDGKAFVKVLDFGISKFQSEANGELRQTQSGITMGTPLYMSPEQLRSARNADARSDVYSLGVILYEMLSGKLPFRADSFAELAVKILHGQFAPLDTLDSQIPRPLSGHVTRALHREPAQRFQTAASLGEALAPFARNRSVSDLLHGGPGPSRRAADTVVPDFVSDPLAPTHATPESSFLEENGSVPPTSSSLNSNSLRPSELESVAPRRRVLVGSSIAVAVAIGAALWAARESPAPIVAVAPRELPPAEPAPIVTAPPVAPPPIAPIPVVAVPVPPTPLPPAPRPVEKRVDARATKAPPAPAAPLRFGMLDLACQPVPCTVTIDGKSEGETPLLGLELSEGSHTAVVVNSETWAKQVRVFQIKAGQHTKVAVSY